MARKKRKAAMQIAAAFAVVLATSGLRTIGLSDVEAFTASMAAVVLIALLSWRHLATHQSDEGFAELLDHEAHKRATLFFSLMTAASAVSLFAGGFA